MMSVTVVPFSMAVMVILHEGRLVDQISSKCNGRYPQPGKRSLEPIVSRKRTCVSPLFATANQKQQQRVKQQLCQKERMPREGEGIGGRGFFFFFLLLSLSLSFSLLSFFFCTYFLAHGSLDRHSLLVEASTRVSLSNPVRFGGAIVPAEVNREFWDWFGEKSRMRFA